MCFNLILNTAPYPTYTHVPITGTTFYGRFLSLNRDRHFPCRQDANPLC